MFITKLIGFGFFVAEEVVGEVEEEGADIGEGCHDEDDELDESFGDFCDDFSHGCSLFL